MDHTLETQPSELAEQIGTGRAPRLIDVCLPEDRATDPWTLPGARLCAHGDSGHLPDPERPVIVICARGLKLSHGVAAHLRAREIAATALAGGKAAWCAADLPRLTLDPGRPALWVLPATPDAAPLSWLVDRWGDPGGHTVLVPADMVMNVAERFEGTALSTENPQDAATGLGLEAPELQEFLADTPVKALLAALFSLHPTPEAATRAALPLIDAAWVAFRGARA